MYNLEHNNGHSSAALPFCYEEGISECQENKTEKKNKRRKNSIWTPTQNEKLLNECATKQIRKMIVVHRLLNQFCSVGYIQRRPNWQCKSYNSLLTDFWLRIRNMRAWKKKHISSRMNSQRRRRRQRRRFMLMAHAQPSEIHIFMYMNTYKMYFGMPALFIIWLWWWWFVFLSERARLPSHSSLHW